MRFLGYGVTEMKSGRGFPWGPVMVISSGGGLIVAGIILAHTGGSRGAQVACGVIATAVLAIGIVWTLAVAGTWQAVRGPWWTGSTEESNQVGRITGLLSGLARDQSHWASPSLRTVRALHADNLKLCTRLDRLAYKASKRGRSNVPAELDAMWTSLLDGRARLDELCHEMAAMAGRAMAAVPVESVVIDDVIVSDLAAFADRANALDAARREFESPPPPSSGSQQDVVHLLRSRAPDLVQPAVALFAESRRRQDMAGGSIKRWQAEIDRLPIETPATDRDRFVEARRSQIAAMEQYLARVRQAEETVAQAARNLSPLLPPTPPPAKEYERGSVEAAEGMINALKEINRRSGT